MSDLTFLRPGDEQWHRPEPPDPAEPTARCCWPIDGEPDGLACGEPAYYVLVSVGEYGQEMIETECSEHLVEALQAATVVCPTHPTQVSLVRADTSMYALGRQLWRTQRVADKRKRRTVRPAASRESPDQRRPPPTPTKEPAAPAAYPKGNTPRGEN